MSRQKQRFDLEAAAPGAEEAIGALDTFVARLAIEPELLELVRVRASQLNGCTYCIETRAQFTEAEIAVLLMAIIAVNAWNRVAISQRLQPVLRRVAVPAGAQ
jgi:AhpD family alkylhydroperoxidase